MVEDLEVTTCRDGSFGCGRGAGVFGFLYGLTEGIGALMAPVFLAYGLVKGAYIGTDALSTFSESKRLSLWSRFATSRQTSAVLPSIGRRSIAGLCCGLPSPGYRWREDLLQFADVRVAT